MLTTSLGQRIIVRFARKPIWMPTAPSKLFRMSVLTRNFYDQEEIVQIEKLTAVYRAQMDSIAKFMEKEFYEPATKAGGIPPEFLELELKEYGAIRAKNDRLNAEIARQKEEYFSKKLHDLEEQAMEDKFSREETVMEASQKVSEYIKQNKDNPESCVTPDNFDAIVEKAMSNPVNYEFCIDTSGRIHR